MSEILILGAKGMLGSMLGTIFTDQKPTLWDRDEIDITSRDVVRQKVISLKPKVIINAAAYTDVDGAEGNKDVAFAVNAEAVLTLAELSKEIDATMIQYSTDYVFSGNNTMGYKETDSPGPAANLYGESKLAGEKALQETNPRYYLLRTAWLYGPNGKNFVDTMLRLADSHTELKVVNDQFGCPTYTKDLAQITRFLIENVYEPGIYHTVNEGVTNWWEFARTIFKFAKKNVTVSAISSREYVRAARRPNHSLLLNTRGPKLRMWSDALREYIGPMDRKTYVT